MAKKAKIPSEVSAQVPAGKGKLKLGHLGTINQVIVGLRRTARAMADGVIDFQLGRAVTETLDKTRVAMMENGELQRLQATMDAIRAGKINGDSEDTVVPFPGRAAQ